MKWRVAIGAAVLAVIVGVVGTVVALAGGSTGQPPTLITQPARYWLGQHAFFVPGQPDRVDIADVARTMLEAGTRLPRCASRRLVERAVPGRVGHRGVRLHLRVTRPGSTTR